MHLLRTRSTFERVRLTLLGLLVKMHLAKMTRVTARNIGLDETPLFRVRDRKSLKSGKIALLKDWSDDDLSGQATTDRIRRRYTRLAYIVGSSRQFIVTTWSL